MRQPLRGQERVRGDAERRVMMEASPAAALEVIEPELVFQFLIVAFDPPAQHGELDEFRARRGRRQRREPKRKRRRFSHDPISYAPFFLQKNDAAPIKYSLSTLPPTAPRSEEHTSELQSRSDLVCRL